MATQSPDQCGDPEVVTIGRAVVDLYPLQDGVRIPEVTTFGKYLGGSPVNVAVGAARHGHRVATITRTGIDPFGEFIHRELARLGVDSRWVVGLPGVRTTVAFCEILPPDEFPLYFYRDRLPPELRLTTRDLDLARIGGARLLWMTATGLSNDPSRDAHRALLASRPDGMVVLDMDYRPAYWDNESDAGTQVRDILGEVDVAVGNLEECRVAVGESEPDRAADALLSAGVSLAVVKMGPAGVLAADGSERVRVPPTPIKVMNGLGAGDAFGGGLIHGLLVGSNLRRTIKFASAAGAIVAGRRECSTAMPTTGEVEEFLAVHSARIEDESD